MPATSDALQIPIDFERLPEFRLLCSALKSKAKTALPASAIEASAIALWMRLWVELSYLARTTNRPGYLTKQGRVLFDGAVDSMFGDDCDAVGILTEGQVLRPTETEDLYCETFAKWN